MIIFRKQMLLSSFIGLLFSYQSLIVQAEQALEPANITGALTLYDQPIVAGNNSLSFSTRFHTPDQDESFTVHLYNSDATTPLMQIEIKEIEESHSAHGPNHQRIPMKSVHLVPKVVLSPKVLSGYATDTPTEIFFHQEPLFSMARPEGSDNIQPDVPVQIAVYWHAGKVMVYFQLGDKHPQFLDITQILNDRSIKLNHQISLTKSVVTSSFANQKITVLESIDPYYVMLDLIQCARNTGVWLLQKLDVFDTSSQVASFVEDQSAPLAHYQPPSAQEIYNSILQKLQAATKDNLKPVYIFSPYLDKKQTPQLQALRESPIKWDMTKPWVDDIYNRNDAIYQNRPRTGEDQLTADGRNGAITTLANRIGQRITRAIDFGPENSPYYLRVTALSDHYHQHSMQLCMRHRKHGIVGMCHTHSSEQQSLDTRTFVIAMNEENRMKVYASKNAVFDINDYLDILNKTYSYDFPHSEDIDLSWRFAEVLLDIEAK